MKREIRKFDVPTRCGRVSIDMPKGSECLAFQNQRESPVLWALVDPDPSVPTEPRGFYFYGTGHLLDFQAVGRFIGTAQFLNGDLVFHLFEAVQ